jgi:hypothetical protein
MRRAAALLVFACTVALVVAAGAGAKSSPNTCDSGTKIDPVVSGVYNLASGATVSLTVYSTDAGQLFDFDTGDPNVTIKSVVVKGGTGSLEWDPGQSNGFGLHAPLNNKSGQWYDLSYLCVVGGGNPIG